MKRAKPQWKIDYEESGQYGRDREKAKTLGHSDRSFGNTYAKDKTEEEWQEKLSTKFFLPIVERENEKKEGWKGDYEESGQYKKDRDKAESFGHSKLSFGVTYGNTKKEENWQESLSTKFFLPIVERKKTEPKVREAWKVKYKESGQYEKDREKAESFGHSNKSLGNSYRQTNTEEEWQEKLSTKFFMPKIEKKKKEEKEGWKGYYETSGQHQKDREKAKALGHSDSSFGNTYGKDKTEEEWQEKLSTKFFLPIVERKKTEPKVREAWKVKYKESGQYEKDREKAESFGHSKRSFSTAYRQTNTEEEWQEKLSTTWFLPSIQTFLETWDGSVATMFGHIEELGYVAPNRPCLISQLIDSIIDWLGERGRHTKPLIQAIRSDDFMDQVTRKEKMLASVA